MAKKKIQSTLKVTTNFVEHSKADKKIVISCGGARSSKTWSILQLLLLKGMENHNYVISVCAENVPFIRRGPLRDFKQILADSGIDAVVTENQTQSIFTLPTGSIIEFVSVDKPSKALGSARDILFINECNSIPYETAFQLMARTRSTVYLDYNPVSDEFWVYTELLQNPDFKGSIDFIHSTYKDNEYLDQSIIDTMLSRASKDTNYRRVYIEGLPGKVEGLILPNFKLIDEIPPPVIKALSPQYFSLDFGWSQDPTSINEVYIEGDLKNPVRKIYINELFYDTKTHNKDLVPVIVKAIERTHYEVVADSAEPRSIDELKSLGLNIFGADKVAGSVAYGLELMSQAEIFITKDSVNTIKEFRNYSWATDQTGRTIMDSKGKPVPKDSWNHSIDGLRYVVLRHNNKKYARKTVPLKTRKGLKPI